MMHYFIGSYQYTNLKLFCTKAENYHLVLAPSPTQIKRLFEKPRTSLYKYYDPLFITNSGPPLQRMEGEGSTLCDVV